MALVYKVHIKGGNDNTTPLPHNHPYISFCSRNFSKLQLAATMKACTYVGPSYMYNYSSTWCYHIALSKM